jgi:RND family efflux transporter MFP subunit
MDEPPDNPTLRRKLRTLGIAALVVALATTIAGVGLRLYQASGVARWTSEQAIPTVTVVTPRTTVAERELVLPGTVRAFIDAPIYARVSGYLKRWYVDIGAPVKAGQLLAELETPELDQQLLQAEADLASARANEQLAATTAARWQRMLASDSVSKQEADEKQGDHEAKRATVAAAQANVARLKATAAFKLITAPFAGVLTARRTDVGALINAGAGSGQELFRVADSRTVRVYVDVPQAYAVMLRTGIGAELHVPENPGKTVAAKVTDTSGSIAETSRTMLVELAADNSSGALLPGSYVDVHFQMPERAGALRLPVSALLFRQHGLKVATVGPGNKVILKSIELGRDFGTEVEVVSGIAAEERVIDNPADGLGDGDTVRVAAAAPPASAAS